MTAATRGLGAYMRTVAKKLNNHKPMSFEDAHALIGGIGGYMDLGYAAAILIRLEQRGVAVRIDGDYNKYVRGPYWQEAADFYKWSVDDEAKE